LINKDRFDEIASAIVEKAEQEIEEQEIENVSEYLVATNEWVAEKVAEKWEKKHGEL